MKHKPHFYFLSRVIGALSILLMSLHWGNLPLARVQAALAPVQPEVAGDEKWDDRFGYPGVGYDINAIAVNGSDMFAGGWLLQSAHTLNTNKIARWDGRRWHAMGGDTDLFVLALAADSNYVYAGGNFTRIGGVGAKSIARWNRSTGVWSALGSGVGPEGGTKEVRAIVIVGDDIYVGGQFDTMDGVVAHNLAKFNTVSNQWSGLGRGLGNTYFGDPNEALAKGAGGVYALAIGPGNKLYAGGSFNTAGNATNLSASNIAEWNTTSSQWSGLGTGVLNNTDSPFGGDVNGLAVLGNDVYATGKFFKAGAMTVHQVAKWDGSQWSALGVGLTSDSDPIGNTVAIAGGKVYIGGLFSTAGGINAWNAARWDPATSAWAALGQGLSTYYPNGAAGAHVNALATTNDGTGVWAGGHFNGADLQWVYYIAKWDGTAWSALGKGIDYGTGPAGRVLALGVAGDGRAYIGGNFLYVHGKPMINSAVWDGTNWSPVGGGIGDDLSSEVDAILIRGDDVYFGGKFSKVGNIAASNIAKWNTTRNEWSALGSGVNSTVYALTLDPVDNTVLVGGEFTSAGSATSGPVARYNPTSNAWSVVIPNYRKYLSDKVYALAADSEDIYVGGDFRDIELNGSNVRSVNSLFVFRRSDETVLYFHNGSTNGVTYKGFWGRVNTLALAPDNGELYVGGRFDTVGGISASGLAVANGSGWHAIGNVGGESDPEVQAIKFAGNDANTVYIGGHFQVAGPTAGKHVAKYDRNADSWSELGSGILADTSLLTSIYGAYDLTPVNGKLYVAGQFLRAGDHPAASFSIYTDPDAVVPNVTPNPQPTPTVTTTPGPKATPTVTITPNPNIKPRAYLPLVRK